jgi:hypothetical protein
MSISIPIPIYKVNHLIGDKIDTIYVFYGNDAEITSTFEEVKRDISILEFKDPLTDYLIFNEEEMKSIRENPSQKVYFSNQQIFSDDSIGAIKLKIVNEFGKKFSPEEIYMFCMKKEILNAVNVYKSLTQNNKLKLTKTRLNQFLSNILRGDDDSSIISPREKGTYNYDDILALNISGKKFWISKVLGQRFFIVENEYPFVCNPFDVTEYDSFIERASRKSLTTLNSHVLLSNGEFIGNNIYLCLAKDVLENAERKGLDELTTIKLYYPFLLKKHDIHSLNELNEKDELLIDETKKMLNKQTIDTFKSVNLFYDMYKERKSELNYKNNGIISIKLILKPEYSMKIPLDIIFKLIHATEGNPLIKMNPATRRENIYRLYVDKISKDGRKIPFLSKAMILKLMQTIGRGKSVAVYIQYNSGIKVFNIICEFEENGNITISCDFDGIVSIQEIDDLFIKAVNPIIEDVKNFLEQSGYSITLFKGVHDESTIISHINYQTLIEIDNVIKIKSFMGCISSAFIVESSELKKGIEMRYKRVSNFNKTTSQEAFVIEKQKQKISEKDIIEGLVENYEMSQSEAINLYARLASELQVERGIRGNDIEIKINPGFKVTMKVMHGTKLLKIDIENINDIYYLNTIPIFIDSLVRLTQDPDSSNIPLKDIKILCSKGEKEEFILEDIISSSEESFVEQEMPTIEGDDIEYHNIKEYNEEYEDGNRMRTAMDLLYEDEYEDEDVDEDAEKDETTPDSSGGATSSSDSVSENELKSSVNNSNSSPLDNSPLDNSPLDSIKSLSSFGSEDIEGLDEIEGLDQLESSEKSESSEKPDNVSTPPIEVIENIPEEPVVGLKSDLESEVSTNKSPVDKSPVDKSPVDNIVTSEKELIEEVEPPVASLQPEPEKILIKPTKVKKLKIKETNKKIENEEFIRDIDGMKLANPTPFFKTMVERDPVLFLTEDSEKFNSYSRTCLSSNRAQPIILNEEEKQKIDKDMPGFLKEDDVIKYGSTPEKQNYYICPRYWCLKTNMPITPEDVKAGKCGKIIPRTGPNSKKVPKGAYVYEFFNPSQHGTQENYIQHYPGFVNDTKSQKHPDNLCIPCCYKDAHSIIQEKMKSKCIKPIKDKEEDVESEVQKISELQEPEEEQKEVEELEELEEVEKPELIKKDKRNKKTKQNLVLEERKEPRVVEKEEEYIQGPEKFPLDKGRWGYLPFQIQKFLHEINADCQISKTNTNIKPHHACLLRHGINYDEKQSFIACIADALFYDKSMSINDMKEQIIRAINIDSFITYQNGNLVQSFSNDSNKDINIDKYKSSKLYDKYKDNMEYFKQIANAFENFIAFLRDDNVVIDYTYLWDIISRPNSELFKSGINIVILEITDNDSTNNISLICPTNHYSNEFYEARKKTLIIMKKVGKKGIFFEPIYSYKDEETKIKVERLFSEYDPHLSKTMRAIFKKLIKPILQNKCLPLSSIPNMSEYKFKRPISLSLLIESLNKAKYEIIQQVINYNNKVIGILAKNTNGKTGFIPCYPSSVDETYDYILISNPGIFNTYSDTVDFLMTFYQNSLGKIPCKPEFKVVEDDVMIVGILTETNQFIELSRPEPLINVNDSLKIFNSSNYLIADKEILLSSEKVDDKRVEYIKKLKLETNFMNVFRNTIRILLNEYDNLAIREEIKELANDIGFLYKNKLKKITQYLKNLVNDKVKFEDYNYEMINEITTCIVNKNDKCESNEPLCAVINDGNTCQLAIPKHNLLNGSDNELIYFAKIADEIIRYNRIKSFLFKPQTYASFSPLNYNLRENEIIIIQSMLNQEYFDGLVPIEINKFIKYNTYDNVEPIKSQTYINEITLDEAINPEESRECIVTNAKNIRGFWKDTFPKNFNEYVYDKTKNCTFYLIIDIVKKVKNIDITENEVRKQLYNAYLKYLSDYEEKIISILIDEGKKTLGDQVKAKILKFQNFIYSDNYFLTNFDLWLLLNIYKIPSFFISGAHIPYNKIVKKEPKRDVFLCYGEPNDKFIFIVIPASSPEKIPKYKLISDEDIIVFSLDELNEGVGLNDLNHALDEKVIIDDFLNEFTKKVNPSNKAVKRKAKLVLKGDETQKHVIIIKKKTKKNKKQNV